ncbi:Protein Y53G8AR.7 a [Aphelenchoides avenae]|nr:Protein Y53G8AR.7 a [Aphelenchus avenae]
MTNVKEVGTTNWRSIYVLTLVAFISTIHAICIIPGVWPYLQKMDPTATETFYGWLRTTSSFGSVVATLSTGWIANKLLNTKGPLIFSKAMAVISCGVYLFVEVFTTGRRAAFLVFELLLGIAVGSSHIARAHIAAVSTEKDRPKAIAITSLAPSMGLFLTPIAQLLFTKLGYPGLPLPFGVHLNLFTAPIITAMIVAAVALFMLVFFFDGHMPVGHAKKEAAEKKESLESASDTVEKPLISDKSDSSTPVTRPVGKFDWIAVLVCFFTKMTTGLTILHFSTIGAPYSMMAFKMTSAETVIFHAVNVGLIGFCQVSWNLAYVFGNLRKKLSERRAVVGAAFTLLAVYLCSYPWSFYPDRIGYREVVVGANSSTIVPDAVQQTANEDKRFLGCPLEYEWCAETPVPNFYLYFGSALLAFGVAVPLCCLNLDILYSKVLGPIPQGTMQAWFLVCGDLLQICGPLVLSKVYTMTGPVYLWQFQIAVVATCIFLWFYFYKRMVSFTERPMKLSKQRV